MIFISECGHCKRKLLMITKGVKLKSYSCSECVPIDSGWRDNINESIDHEFQFLTKKKNK